MVSSRCWLYHDYDQKLFSQRTIRIFGVRASSFFFFCVVHIRWKWNRANGPTNNVDVAVRRRRRHCRHRRRQQRQWELQRYKTQSGPKSQGKGSFTRRISTFAQSVTPFSSNTHTYERVNSESTTLLYSSCMDSLLAFAKCVFPFGKIRTNASQSASTTRETPKTLSRIRIHFDLIAVSTEVIRSSGLPCRFPLNVATFFRFLSIGLC